MTIVEERNRILADRDLDGRAMCRALSDATDVWLRELASAAIGDRPGISLVAVGGYMSAYAMMFVSDVLDSRPIEQRRLRSRFFNGCGLLILLLTFIAVLGLAAFWFIQSTFWLLGEMLLDG